MEIFLLWVPSMTKYFVTFSRNGKISWYVLNVYPPLAKYSNSWQDIHWWRPSRLPARASKHQTQASYRLEIYIFFFRKIPFPQNGFDQINKNAKQSNPTCMLGPRDDNKLQESTSWPQLVRKSKSYFIAIYIFRQSKTLLPGWCRCQIPPPI